MQQKIRFQIEGMTCQACASRIEKVLNKKDFIESAGVNFASEEAQVTFDDSKTSIADIIAIIQKTGYGAQEKTEELPQAAPEAHIGWRLWLLFAINIPFLIGMAGMLVGRNDWMIPPYVQFALASIVQLWLAVPFYKSAWASIKGGLANMDVLVSIGTVATYAYSTAMLFFAPHGEHGLAHGGQIYFEAGVMVIGFVSLGKYLEHRAKKNSLNSLSLLLKLTPPQVMVERDGHWQTLPLDQVQIGDHIRANHGERIAADGTVESGSGWADESHLTGESRPEAKEAGSRVLAGALMSDGSITYRAEQLGSHTLLGDMMNALSEAQGSKAPIARLADKTAAIFVPTVVAIAVATFILTGFIKDDWTRALMHAVAVLVIACPCALGLATPAAIMVGMGKAVQRGIRYKDAAAMEEAAHVNTKGNPVLSPPIRLLATKTISTVSPLPSNNTPRTRSLVPSCKRHKRAASTCRKPTTPKLMLVQAFMQRSRASAASKSASLTTAACNCPPTLTLSGRLPALLLLPWTTARLAPSPLPIRQKPIAPLPSPACMRTVSPHTL